MPCADPAVSKFPPPGCELVGTENIHRFQELMDIRKWYAGPPATRIGVRSVLSLPVGTPLKVDYGATVVFHPECHSGILILRTVCVRTFERRFKAHMRRDTCSVSIEVQKDAGRFGNPDPVRQTPSVEESAT